MKVLNVNELHLVVGAGNDEENTGKPALVSGECLLATAGMMVSALAGPISFFGGLINAVNSCILKD